MISATMPLTTVRSMQFQLYNWWGSSTGPTADDNPGGTGSALNGLVQYRPWLTSPGTQFLFLPLTTK